MVTISVIMGIYNCATTLQTALDSLYGQTFQDFEIILCDDGSTDGTLLIAEENRKKHSNIILLKNGNNRGLNYTLNRCLEHVKGKYIARMDGDDISLPMRFEKEYNFLESHPEYAIVSTAMIHFDEMGDFKEGNPKEYPQERDLIKGTPFAHAPCMVRKDAYSAVNGYSVSKWLLRVEDYHLWVKMYAKGYRGYNFKESLYKMRDDRQAFARRKYRYRLNEAYVKYLTIKMCHLPWYYIVYMLKPLIVGLLPKAVYDYFRKRQKNFTV